MSIPYQLLTVLNIVLLAVTGWLTLADATWPVEDRVIFGMIAFAVYLAGASTLIAHLITQTRSRGDSKL